MLVVGRNGAGKTNLLESLHLATQGFSPRTRQDTQLIRFGESAARVSSSTAPRGPSPIELSVTLRAGQAKEARLNGAPLPSADVAATRGGDARLHARPPRRGEGRAGCAPRVLRPRRSLASPRRGPACRRTTSRRSLSGTLRFVACSSALADRDSLEPWTDRLATLAAALVAERRATLGGARAGLRRQRPVSSVCRKPVSRTTPSRRPRTISEARLARDLERGTTGLGPHLDDVLIASGERDLRQFGSQGEQRLAVLSLLLAEAELLPMPPLLLLDDVLSELDLGRREVLAARVAGMGQTVITATHRSALAGRARPARGGGEWIRSVRRSGPSSSRHGPQAGMAELVDRWTAAVGESIARNAWPSRIARDGTVHASTSDSVWAFELGQRAGEIAASLGVPKVRFAPGPLPEPPAEPPVSTPLEVTPEDAERARAIASSISDEKLRESVQKAVSFSLARGRSDTPI